VGRCEYLFSFFPSLIYFLFSRLSFIFFFPVSHLFSFFPSLSDVRASVSHVM
jgi:hypothetical protein